MVHRKSALPNTGDPSYPHREDPLHPKPGQLAGFSDDDDIIDHRNHLAILADQCRNLDGGAATGIFRISHSLVAWIRSIDTDHQIFLYSQIQPMALRYKRKSVRKIPRTFLLLKRKNEI